MRDYHRNEVERPRLNLVRGPDGRLKLAGRSGDDNGARQAPFSSAVVDFESRPVAVRQSQSQAGVSANAPKPMQRAGDVGREQREPGRRKRAVRFKLPKVRVPRPSLPKLRMARAGKYVLAATSVAAVAVLGIVVYGKIAGPKGDVVRRPPQQASGVLNVADAQEQKPQFDTVLPQGKAIEDLGGWVRVSPTDKDPVFAFVDVVDGTQLNVSQQQLPENLRTDTSKKVAELATGFAANEKIDAHGLEAYVGTSIRGPQSVIFVKNNLLILIKSSGKLTNQQWADYIESLH